MTIYNAPLFTIDKNETKRYAGLGTTEFDEKMIEEACLNAQLQSKPKGIWQLYDYDSISGEVKSTPSAYIKGEKIKDHLKNATKVIFLAITIGEEVEKEITAHFQEGVYAYSLLLDAAATTAVETAADKMEKAIQQDLIKQGYQTLMRFSPGYGDWDIAFQSEMLRLSHAAEIHIEMTESYMLIPRKSITAILGVVPNQDGCSKHTNESCSICEKKDCLARKEI